MTDTRKFRQAEKRLHELPSEVVLIRDGDYAVFATKWDYLHQCVNVILEKRRLRTSGSYQMNLLFPRHPPAYKTTGTTEINSRGLIEVEMDAAGVERFRLFWEFTLVSGELKRVEQEDFHQVSTTPMSSWELVNWLAKTKNSLRPENAVD